MPISFEKWDKTLKIIKKDPSKRGLRAADRDRTGNH